MASNGVQCQVELLVAGQAARPVGEFRLTESVREGSRLRVALDAESAMPNVGDPIEVRVSEIEPARGREVRLVLWCRQIRVVQESTRSAAWIDACDPLGFSRRQPEFISHAGGRPLLALVDSVLWRQPGRLESLRATSGSSPALPDDWLLQCAETGADFVARVAHRCGQAVFWNRESYVASTVGEAPRSDPPARLQMGQDLVSFATVSEPDLHAQRFAWCDNVSRAVQETSLAGNGLGRPAPALAGRSALAQRFSALAASGSVGAPWIGPRIEVETLRPDIRLGAAVAVGEQPVQYASVIEHFIHSQGSYRNSVVGVSAERWGMGGPRVGRCLLGPFQAEVTHNDDPLEQQRIRVALCEDPARRPGPWIPIIAPGVGSGRGCYWLPEVGDLVMVAAEAGSPESLVSIGSIRGENGKAAEGWRDGGNARKALAVRKGVQIVLDDVERTLRLEAGDSVMQLGPDGIELSGSGLEISMEDQARIRAGSRVAVDANRIDLGE